jgi:hypothetical protein
MEVHQLVGDPALPVHQRQGQRQDLLGGHRPEAGLARVHPQAALQVGVGQLGRRGRHVDGLARADLGLGVEHDDAELGACGQVP